MIMDKNDIELRSPKVQNVIGRMPRGLIITALFVYLVVLIFVFVVVLLLNIDSEGILNRIIGI